MMNAAGTWLRTWARITPPQPYRFVTSASIQPNVSCNNPLVMAPLRPNSKMAAVAITTGGETSGTSAR